MSCNCNFWNEFWKFLVLKEAKLRSSKPLKADPSFLQNLILCFSYTYTSTHETKTKFCEKIQIYLSMCILWYSLQIMIEKVFFFPPFKFLLFFFIASFSYIICFISSTTFFFHILALGCSKDGWEKYKMSINRRGRKKSYRQWQWIMVKCG